ncbi:hypothetical protein N8865_00670 [Francisellaceae bacterium]|nr:hypothetical protein [Francisellaceae bacterium]
MKYFRNSLLLLCVFLVGCVTAPPQNIGNACAIVQEYPDWFYDAKRSYEKWGVPISVQFAMIHKESHFVGDAQPPRTKLLGFIPWSRESSAYGYAQALDGTWAQYQRDTGNPGGSRTNFADSVDFLGWYANFISKRTGIPKSNTYKLYLAYHQGPNGFLRGSYKNQPWLMNYAKSAQAWAWRYASQLKTCKVPSESWW